MHSYHPAKIPLCTVEDLKFQNFCWMIGMEPISLRKLHCNPVQGQYRDRTGFSLWSFPHREKSVFITGNPCSHCRDPCFHYREFPVRKLHRENPVFIAGNGFAVYILKTKLVWSIFCTKAMKHLFLLKTETGHMVYNLAS